MVLLQPPLLVFSHLLWKLESSLSVRIYMYVVLLYVHVHSVWLWSFINLSCVECNCQSKVNVFLNQFIKTISLLHSTEAAAFFLLSSISNFRYCNSSSNFLNSSSFSFNAAFSSYFFSNISTADSLYLKSLILKQICENFKTSYTILQLYMYVHMYIH